MHNVNWEKQKVNINDVVDRFAPKSKGYADGIKFIFKGENYLIKADMASGYLRIVNNKGQYVKLDGTPGTRAETHFKIKKREEM